MTGPLRLAIRHLGYHWVRSGILAACVATACAIPLMVEVLVRNFQKSLIARAAQTPALIGAKGNRFDLTMSLLYFRPVELTTTSFAEFRQLQGQGGGVFIPVNARFTARQRPVVATTTEYFELRGLRVAGGTMPLVLGDAVLGARMARDLGLGVGDAIFSDQRDLFDISKPPALKLRIVGVLAPSGGPDDAAMFTDIKTAWILEGLSHAHLPPNQVPSRLVLDRDAKGVRLSEELIDYNEVTATNRASFHLHAAETQLPLSGVIVIPDSTKAGTLLITKLNAGPTLQAVVPMEVVADLLAYVLRIRTLFAVLSWVLGLFTLILIAMVTALSIRVRARELETLRRIGVARATIGAMFAWELVLVALGGVCVAVLGAWGVALSAPDLVKLL